MEVQGSYFHALYSMSPCCWTKALSEKEHFCSCCTCIGTLDGKRAFINKDSFIGQELFERGALVEKRALNQSKIT